MSEPLHEPSPNCDGVESSVEHTAVEAAETSINAAVSSELSVESAAKKSAHSEAFFEALQFALVTAVILLFVLTFIAQAFRIPSGSMEDTLLVGDFLLVDKSSFAPGGDWRGLLPYPEVRRQQIVIFHYPEDPEQFFIKRVVGLPGDRVRLRRGRVLINGAALAEPYAVFKERAADEFRDEFPAGRWNDESISDGWRRAHRSFIRGGELVVPPGCYFVLGDNRDRSLDGRYWGFVPRENLVGRPVVIYFSISSRDDDDDAGESQPSNDKLAFPGILRGVGELRWQRMLRLVP